MYKGNLLNRFEKQVEHQLRQELGRFVEQIGQMIQWRTKFFTELSLEEMYHLMVLRQEVFVVEQDCPYLDADGKDFQSHHVMGYFENQLIACARIVAPGISYAEISIGRVATASNVRGKGYGKDLMHQCHEEISRIYGHASIRISAQSYLKDFYGSLGYLPTGKEYLEDGIPHMEMLKN